jgi:hypothetical protein
MSPNAGEGGGRGGCWVSANEYSCADGAQINFGDFTPYLTFGLNHGQAELLSSGGGVKLYYDYVRKGFESKRRG